MGIFTKLLTLNSAEFEASKNDDLKKETKKIKTNLPELFK